MKGPSEVAKMLQLVAVGTRVRMIRLLKGRALCVGALAANLGVTQGAVSQHLRKLKEANIVVPEKRGCFVHYRLSATTLRRWRRVIAALLGPGAARGRRCSGRRR